MKIEIVKTSPKHIAELKESMRDEDRREIIEAGLTVRKALWRSYKNSLICETVLVEDEVAAIFGLGGSHLGNTGIPWLLTGRPCEKVSPLKFARIYQKQVERMLEHFPRLANYVDATYTKAVRLMENIGFKIGEPEQIGLNNRLFCRFEMVKTWR